MTTHGRKMALIPIDMLKQKQNLTPLTSPNKDQVVKKMDEVSSLLDDEHLPESLKVSRLNEKLNNYSVFADKLIEEDKIQDDDDDDLFNPLPKTFRQPAKVLMSKLKKHSKVIKWDPITNEVTLHGKVLRGSNILDLVGDVLRSRKSTPPMHSDIFLKTLANLNMPEEFVKNKYRISKFRSYKQRDEVDGGQPAKRRPKERFNSTKRYLNTPLKKKQYKWLKV